MVYNNKVTIMVSTSEKKCRQCNRIKNASKFYKSTRSKDGLQSWCKNCSSIRGKRHYRKNKNAINKQHRQHYNTNREKTLARCKAYERDNKEKIKNNYLIRTYNITLTDYNNILKRQKYKCSICKTLQCSTGKNFSVDHCHRSNKVRGLLCQQCNTGLGKLKDSLRILKNAYNYVKQWRK